VQVEVLKIDTWVQKQLK